MRNILILGAGAGGTIVATNNATLQAEKFERVYVIGDTTNVPTSCCGATRATRCPCHPSPAVCLTIQDRVHLRQSQNKVSPFSISRV
jgi:NADH dehydrogenase FAD-containing subunit